jgi:hypothetical protein
MVFYELDWGFGTDNTETRKFRLAETANELLRYVNDAMQPEV